MLNWLNPLKGPTLTGFWKYFFVVTAFPLLIVGMILNMWLLQKFLPGFFDLLIQQSSARVRRWASSAGFVLTVPLSVALCVIWYKVIQAVSGAGTIAEPSEKDQKPE